LKAVGHLLTQLQVGLGSYARVQPSFRLILVEQRPQPFLNAGRSVFSQEFEHQPIESSRCEAARRSSAACRWAALCRYCCKSPKLPGTNFLAAGRSPRSLNVRSHPYSRCKLSGLACENEATGAPPARTSAGTTGRNLDQSSMYGFTSSFHSASEWHSLS